MPLTAVLDTNVIVRAQISPFSWSARVFDAFLDGRFNMAVSESILDEVAQVLSRPHVRALTGLSEVEIDEFVSLLRSLAILTTALYAIRAVADDPDDDKFLECGVEARADYTVSLDDHLLSMKEFRLLDYHVPIMDVARFAEVLSLHPTRT
jgi:putative PIN family toxin of toxin-antitoxin system